MTLSSVQVINLGLFRSCATDLDLLLRNLGVRSVVLNGGFTDCCILNTVFDAANRTYRVVVPRDLVRGTDEYLENAALAMISLHLGLMTEASSLLDVWRKASESIASNTISRSAAVQPQAGQQRSP